MNVIKILLAPVFLGGCSLTNMVWSTEPRISDKVVQAMRESQAYLGKSKQDVSDAYGKPLNITYDSADSSGLVFEEAWLYRFDAGVPVLLPDQYGIIFYFNADRVAMVRGL